jgi:hypothetical protein
LHSANEFNVSANKWRCRVNQATHQNPALRDLTVGDAVNALVLHGLGYIHQALSWVPWFFHHQPT